MPQRIYTIMSHLATWVVLFLLPMSFQPLDLPLTLIPTAAVVATFYLNYWCLAPLYMSGYRAAVWGANAVLVLTLMVVMHWWIGLGYGYAFNLAVAVMVSISEQMAKHWQKAEQARLKAEEARACAELSNLRYQTNPHFLLNTLNNIYALTAFDVPRAQQAIQQLSGMLRHILYDNQEREVSIGSEVEFLQNYIKLMKIRMPSTVDVTFDIGAMTCDAKITPLILIPLVENAFKHGVSTTKPSFIHMTLSADTHQIDFKIENSNHQKTNDDHSGHGIGLVQVKRRLELAYPNSHSWQYGLTDDKTCYRSHICIKLDK